MMKILQVVKELDAGGVERMLANYYAHMDTNKYRFDFLVLSHHRGLVERNLKNATIYHVTPREENTRQNFTEMNRVIGQGDYDVVHTHIDKQALFPLLSAKLHRVPGRIAHSHMAVEQGLPEKIIYPTIQTLATELCACGIDAGKVRFGEKAYQKDKITIINNAIDIPAFQFRPAIREKVRKEMNLAEDEAALCCVGRFTYQKNHAYLLEVYREYKRLNAKAKLFLLGNGELKAELRTQIKEKGIEDVVFLGTRNDVNEVLQGMDAFLLPSFFEGLPVVLVEAQCTGIECFVSDKVTREIEKTEHIHYLDIESAPVEWARAIQEKLAVPRDRTESCRLIEEGGYSIKKESKKLEAFYSKYRGRV